MCGDVEDEGGGGWHDRGLLEGISAVVKMAICTGKVFTVKCQLFAVFWLFDFYLFVLGFMSLSTLYRSYHDG